MNEWTHEWMNEWNYHKGEMRLSMCGIWIREEHQKFTMHSTNAHTKTPPKNLIAPKIPAEMASFVTFYFPLFLLFLCKHAFSYNECIGSLGP